MNPKHITKSWIYLKITNVIHNSYEYHNVQRTIYTKHINIIKVIAISMEHVKIIKCIEISTKAYNSQTIHNIFEKYVHII